VEVPRLKAYDIMWEHSITCDYVAENLNQIVL